LSLKNCTITDCGTMEKNDHDEFCVSAEMFC